jgi:hypothetical protein
MGIRRYGPLQVAALFSKKTNTFIDYLIRTYGLGAFVKLNDVKTDATLPTLLSGGADDTLSAGAVVSIDGENWMNGAAYADDGLTALTMNSKTYLFGMIPNAADLSTTAYYLGQLYVDANNLINYRTTATADQFIAEYIGQSTSETITVSNLVADKTYWGALIVPDDTENMLLYLNGLLKGAVTLANAISGTDIDNANTAIGASNTSGSNRFNGYKWERQVHNSELTGYQIRRDHLQALGVNVLGHHTTYGVDGGGTGYLSVPASDDINNIFDGGGAVAWQGRILSNNASRRYIDKRVAGGTGWAVFQSVSGDSSRIAFSHEFNNGADDGYWATDVITKTNEPMLFLIKYNSDSPLNDPTFYVIIGHTVYDLTVGAGLSEALTPSGTRDSDASRDLGVLADANGSQISDMEVHQVALFNHTDVSITALGQDWSSQSPVAYWKMGNYADASGNFDYILTDGSGTIYDATGNGNDATPNSMDEANLIENRATRYETSLSNLASYFDYMFAGYGDKFRIHDGSTFGATDYGTALARDGEDWQGFAEIAFDGVAGVGTSYIDLSTLLSGEIPSEFTFVIRIDSGNWSFAGSEVFLHLSTPNGRVRILINTASVLQGFHKVGATDLSTAYNAGSSVGYATIALTVDAVNTTLHFNGVAVGTPIVNSATLTGTINSAIVGAINSSPQSVISGNINFIGYAETALSDAKHLAIHRQLARVED